MVKTFCDRCGAEIHNKYGWLRRTTRSCRLRLNSTETYKDTNEDKYICPDCVKSFRIWFDNSECCKAKEEFKK